MKISLPISAVDTVLSREHNLHFRENTTAYDYGKWAQSDIGTTELDTVIVGTALINEIIDYIEEYCISHSCSAYNAKFSMNALNRAKNRLKKVDKYLLHATTDTQVIKDLKLLPDAVNNWIVNNNSDLPVVKLENSLGESAEVNVPVFFIEHESLEQQMYILTSCTYVRPKRDSVDNRPYVEFVFQTSSFNSRNRKSFCIYAHQLKKLQTLPRIFSAMQVEICTQSEYVEYNNYVDEAIRVMQGTGIAYDCVSIMRVSSKGIIDPISRKMSPIVVIDDELFSSRHSEKTRPMDFVLGSSPQVQMALPMTTEIRGYHLATHSTFVGDVRNFKLHEYAGIALMDKLVIQEDHKTMIKMLVRQSKIEKDDIISGKSGGALVISKGPAGVGKTLTAEIASESIGLPLYEVQCSQLGIRAEDIEKRLDEILERGKRWNAILLINEADVYIRERGTDINHNAIVGVFLRLLEKSSGIIFMTTNIESVDSAISSRAIMTLNYKKPEKASIAKIFETLSANYDLRLEDNFSEKLLLDENSALHVITGRDVKQLCKLAAMYTSDQNLDVVTVELFKMLLNYK